MNADVGRLKRRGSRTKIAAVNIASAVVSPATVAELVGASASTHIVMQSHGVTIPYSVAANGADTNNKSAAIVENSEMFMVYASVIAD